MALFEEERGRAEADAAEADAAGAAGFDAALERVIASGFDERVVGHEILSLATKSVAQASQFAAAVTAAYRTSAAH